MFLGDLLWMTARGLYKNFEAPSYRSFCKKLETAPDARSGAEIVDHLAEKFRQRIASREKR